jgi:2-methylcitrate dehydratase PrpD
MGINIADDITDYLHELNNSKISDEALMQSKRCLLDYLGVTLAGAKMLMNKEKIFLDSFKRAKGKSTVFGLGKKSSLESSIFINGLSSHMPELDDGVNSGIVHPGSPIFSSLLPVVEQLKVRGDKLLPAIVTAYEVTIMIADAIQPSHKKKGYHATGTCGTIGSAVGVAAMLGYNKQNLKNAISSAAVSASGSLKVLEDCSELKPYNIARASLNGFLSANMSLCGFIGPYDVFSGNNGFFNIMTDNVDLSKIKTCIDNTYEISKIYVKPYAACRYCHPSIDAALKIKSEQTIDHADIEKIDIRTYYWAVEKHDHTDIENISSAKMSIPYSVAVALQAGNAGLQQYTDDYIKNSDIKSLTKKISVFADETMTDSFPKKCCATVDVRLKNGTIYSSNVEYPKGEPESPLSNLEMEEKFTLLASYSGKKTKEIRNIIDIVWNCEKDLPRLFSYMK